MTVDTRTNFYFNLISKFSWTTVTVENFKKKSNVVLLNPLVTSECRHLCGKNECNIDVFDSIVSPNVISSILRRAAQMFCTISYCLDVELRVLHVYMQLPRTVIMS